MISPDLLNLKEVAKILRLHPEHVRARLSRRADFPRPFRLGGALRFDRAEIYAWIDSHRQLLDGRVRKVKGEQ